MGKVIVGEITFSVEKTQVFMEKGGEEDRYEIYGDLEFLAAANRRDAMTLYRLLGKALGMDGKNETVDK